MSELNINMARTGQIQRENRRTIVLLLLAFLAPVLTAYLVYLNMGEISKTRNHGELVIPPRPLTEIELTGLDGKPFSIEQLQGNWHLVYIGSGPCAAGCRDRLSTMHQTRMGQGSAMSRVRLLYIAPDKLQPGATEQLTGEFARLSILTGDEEQINKAKKLFELDTQQGGKGDLIFLVDPLGNLMMRYNKGVSLIGIIKDLEHLLKISQIG